MSVALAKVFRTALPGVCTSHPELAASPLPLEACIPVLPSPGGPELVEQLFCPLGWEVEITPHPADETVPDWGASPYVSLRLSGRARLHALLEHLYVFLPVLDNDKHYWFGRDELDKLLRRGGDWLGAHPAKELIVGRYLRFRRALADEALERLVGDDVADPAAVVEDGDDAGPVAQATVRLADTRMAAVVAALKGAGAQRVLDVGCGTGALLTLLIADPGFTAVGGMDVSPSALAVAQRRLHLDRMPALQRERLTLFQGALTYRDDRLRGWDAITCVEVVEHLDPARLDAYCRVLFGHAQAPTVLLTTPNREHNVRFPSLPPGGLRHRDHRFEWTRAEFRAWTGDVGGQYGYAVEHRPVGPDDPEVGAPTQMAVFTWDPA